jgi:hypothetical protein
MNKSAKPASLLLYLLAFIDFFLAGGFYVQLTGEADGQGLAAGATVFEYAILFAVAAFIASFFLVRYANRRSIILVNWVLLLLFIIELGIITYQVKNKEEKHPPTNEIRQNVTTLPALL